MNAYSITTFTAFHFILKFTKILMRNDNHNSFSISGRSHIIILSSSASGFTNNGICHKSLISMYLFLNNNYIICHVNTCVSFHTTVSGSLIRVFILSLCLSFSFLSFLSFLLSLFLPPFPSSFPSSPLTVQRRPHMHNFGAALRIKF